MQLLKRERMAQKIKNFLVAVIDGVRTVAPPEVRQKMEKYGDYVITEFVISRHPIASFIKKIGNIITLGDFEKNQKRMGYDDVYHLFVLLKGKNPVKPHDEVIFKCHKEEVVRLEIVSSGDFKKLLDEKPESTKTFKVAPKNQKALLLWFSDAQKYLGGDRMYSYDSTDNNCQVFVTAIISGQQNVDAATKKWITQDAFELISNNTTLAFLMRKLTDISAIGDRIKNGTSY